MSAVSGSVSQGSEDSLLYECERFLYPCNLGTDQTIDDVQRRRSQDGASKGGIYRALSQRKQSAVRYLMSMVGRSLRLTVRPS